MTKKSDPLAGQIKNNNKMIINISFAQDCKHFVMHIYIYTLAKIIWHDNIFFKISKALRDFTQVKRFGESQVRFR